MNVRVAFYIDSLKAGGAERVTLRMAQWCQAAGHRPVLLTRRPASHDFYPIPEGVLRQVELPDPVWVAAWGWLGFPWRVLQLRRWLRRNRIEIAIGMTTLPAIKLILAAWGLPLKCWISERNYPPPGRHRSPGACCDGSRTAGLIFILCKPARPAHGSSGIWPPLPSCCCRTR